MDLSSVWIGKRQSLAAAMVLVALAGASCGGRKTEALYGMGDRVEVGRFIYNVLEAQWRPRLGEGASAKLPANHFLLLRVGVTNGSNRDFFMPQLVLVGMDGKEFQELSEVESLPDWFGVLRKIGPAETVTGWVVFDAPRGDYRLRVADDELEASESKTALIDIPIRMASTPQGVSWDGSGQ